jgi:deoxyribodipyrimidine photolyase-related protein
MSSKSTLLILGNQLFPIHRLKAFRQHSIFMSEDPELCTYFKFHKQKIVLFLSAMRSYRDELREAGFDVNYVELEEARGTFEERLTKFLKTKKIESIDCFEIEDKFFEKRLLQCLDQKSFKVEMHPSPMFLTSRSDFQAYLGSVKRPFMKTFYERQRRQLKVLMDGSGKPVGGQYSFDAENRKAMPKSVEPPPVWRSKASQHVESVKQLVERRFSDHPGELDPFIWATSRGGALQALQHFCDKNLENFGAYQDALHSEHEFNFHSILSPYLNMGLLTPEEVVTKIASYYPKKSLNSIEGFIRQVLGWREFIRGVYQNYSDQQSDTNFWNHQAEMTSHWYTAKTGIPILDDVIRKTLKYGYAHHIERLMVLSNWMLLCELHPQNVYRWFMEMFVDSSDWVMGPNVFGMGQFSDGGIFATKPYISGSNYLLKMSNYPKGPWCEIHDGLFWSFLDRHQKFFSQQPRLNMLLQNLKRMPAARKKSLFEKAAQFKAQVTRTKK